MLPEYAQVCLALAFCLSLLQAFFGLTGAWLRRVAWQRATVGAAAGAFVFIWMAFAALGWSFLDNDFSVAYVAENSNSKLPSVYRLAAIWGGHEGSLLLWVVILSTWTMAVAAFSRHLPREISSRIIGVMGIIGTGFLVLTLLTSNPFLRLAQVPADGNDLNPLLQDPAMALHPPMLYAGYVGFAVAFAFAVAALLAGHVNREWARWARPWTGAAWVFLTCGIALGSWWAYYELGWGGWWFWDPVENASFMPWLVGTALIHSLAVTEKRGLFMGTTLLLAISAFSLSLLGTFLVRSGILVSVHAFASDPTRGLVILMFLAIVVGGALALYAWRAPALDIEVGFRPLSRESFLLVNNILLCVAAGLILLGTLYPLVLDALDRGKISVGPPYFETAFLIPMLPLLLAVGLGTQVTWRSAEWSRVLRRIRIPAITAVACGVILPYAFYGAGGALTVVGVAAAAWLIGTALIEPVAQLRGGGPRLTLAGTGMNLAHLGVGLFVLGVTVSSSFGIETDQRIVPGETVSVGEYAITFRGTTEVAGVNYRALRGEVEVSRGGRTLRTLYPEKRTYFVRTMPMTEADIDGRWARDVFVALGEDLGGEAWSMRIQYKPLIRFIWFGCLVMSLGGLLAILDRRYRAAAPVMAAAAAEAAPR